MPDFIYRPNADGSVLLWTPLGGGAHWVEVDEDPPDDDGSYIWCGPFVPDGPWLDLVHVQNPGAEILPTYQVNYIEVYHRGKAVPLAARVWVGPCIYNAALGWAGVYYGATVRYTGLGYTTFSYRWWTNPDSGLGWAVSDLTDLEIGVNKAGANDTVRCTQLYLLVNASERVSRGAGLEDWQ